MSNPNALQTARPSPTPSVKKTPHVATADELRVAQAQLERTRHANTYDNGLGANSTCALCKAPRNYDLNPAAMESAEDCAACKRQPGQPRPNRDPSIPVARQDWKSIGRDVCHQPVGSSYSTAISYWNPTLGQYEVDCTACHDVGHLAVWKDPNPSSRYYGRWMPQPMAHDLRSWPSHNLEVGVDCTRCHYPPDPLGTALFSVECTNAMCHPPGKCRNVR